MLSLAPEARALLALLLASSVNCSSSIVDPGADDSFPDAQGLPPSPSEPGDQGSTADGANQPGTPPTAPLPPDTPAARDGGTDVPVARPDAGPEPAPADAGREPQAPPGRFQAGKDCKGASTTRLPVRELTWPPAYLATVVDEYGTKITRITGDPDTPVPGLPGQRWGTRTRTMYSTHQAFSSDEKLLYLWFGSLLLDGESYRPIGTRRLPGYAYWHPTKPDIMVAIDNNAVVEVNLRSEARTTVMAMPAGYRRMWINQANTSLDDQGRFMAVKAERTDGAVVMVALDLVEKKKASVDIRFDDHQFTHMEDYRRSTGITPSGRFIRMSGWMHQPGIGHPVRDWNTEAVKTFDFMGNKISEWTMYPHCPGHGDYGLDLEGNDVLAGRCDDVSGYRLVMFRLGSGEFVPRLGANASHHSMQSRRRPGWVFASGIGNGIIKAIRLDGRREEFYANARDCGSSYWNQPQGVPSWEGTRVVFASCGPGEVQTFVADFRDQCRD